MGNFTQRLLLFLFGLPLLLFLIVFFDQYGHSGWAILIALFTFLAGYESLKLFIPDYPRPRHHLVALLAMLLPVTTYMEFQFFPGLRLVLPALGLAITGILTVELVHWDRKDPEMFTRRSLAVLGVLIYPGILMIYPMRFISFQHTTATILLFLLLNFGNDTFAYIFGMLFGKNSKKIVPVSPKKTRIGFIGGFAGALIVGGTFYLIYPDLFKEPFFFQIPFFLLIALCADIGDLVESAFKRGAAKKDSGKLMPGRGGLLDSLDSLLFSAPFFYYIGTILLN